MLDCKFEKGVLSVPQEIRIEFKNIENPCDVYDYMVKLPFPYNYEMEYSIWEKSFLYDVDGEGRTLFSNLATIGAYLDDRLLGFIQFGNTAFGFDDNGELTDKVSYSVIRNFYFDEEQRDAGVKLLDEAVKTLSVTSGRIYAFFHYFGMSCYARHGKLYEGFEYIHDLLEQKGFVIEHENVFYSSNLNSEKQTGINIKWHDSTTGGQQYCDFIRGDEIVGGCEIHFLPQENIAYLRWIFINENMCGKGVGSECMTALKYDLFARGISKFDTDTALINKVAQHFYEKNNFAKEGFTRSYYMDVQRR